MKKRLSARTKIQRCILGYITRKRWRDALEAYAVKRLEIVVRIQQRFRFKRRREAFMNYFRVRKRAALKL